MTPVKAHYIKLAAFIIMIDTALRISISKCWQEDTRSGKLEKETTSTRIVEVDTPGKLEKENKRTTRRRKVSLPMVYVITPTYARATQMADLTRLSQVKGHIVQNGQKNCYRRREGNRL